MLDAAGLDDDGPDLGDGAAAPDLEPPTGYPARPLDQCGRLRNPAHGGRPTLYTVPNVLAILAVFFHGATRAEASRRAGVGVSTFYLWLQLVRAASRNRAIGPCWSPSMDSAFCRSRRRRAYIVSAKLASAVLMSGIGV
jgi:hypothetical protein